MIEYIIAAQLQAPHLSLEQTVRAALIDAYNCGEQRQECGGVIYRDDRHRHYSYSTPMTSGRAFGVDLSTLYVHVPVGMRVVADYHTHICSRHNKVFADFFSASDALINEGLHTVGYILSGCTGAIHRYDPEQDPQGDEEVDLSSGRKIFLTSGHVSGWIDIFN